MVLNLKMIAIQIEEKKLIRSSINNNLQKKTMLLKHLCGKLFFEWSLLVIFYHILV